MAISEKAAERAHCLLETGQYSDLVVEVTHGTEKNSIKVHRAVLTIASSVWASAVKWSQDGVLPVTVFPYTSMHTIIYFAYTRRVTFENLTHCQSVLAAAHYYDMPKLLIKCDKYIQALFMKNELDLGTIIQLFNMAALYDSKIVIHNSLEYIEDNTKLVLDSEEFLDISADALLIILVEGMNEEGIYMFLWSENYMIRSVLRWAANAFVKSNCEDLREFLIQCNFLPNFRLGKLQNKEMQALSKDYPTIFSSTSSDSNPINNDIELGGAFSRLSLSYGEGFRDGIMNRNLKMKVIVRCPPMVICEEIYNNGPTILLIICAIKIAARYNLVIPDLSGQYEEKFSVSINNIVSHFKGIADKPWDGTTMHFLMPVSFMIKRDSTFKIYITLDKCGVYYKNCNSLLIGNSFYRKRPGLVMNINKLNFCNPCRE